MVKEGKLDNNLVKIFTEMRSKNDWIRIN
jgi:hypothetical protein